MAEEQAIADVMNLLEAEPNAGDAGVVESITRGPDIPAMREQPAVLVSMGKAKEGHWGGLTHEEVTRLTDKDVEKYSKRYETYVGSKTTESLIGSMIDLYAYAASPVLNIQDVDRLKEDLKKDFTINKELTIVAGSLALKFGRFLALANTALITTRRMAFINPEITPEAVKVSNSQQFQNIPRQFRKNPQQLPVIPEHSATISEKS